MDLFLETPQQQAERMLRQQQRLMEIQMQGAALQPFAQNVVPAAVPAAVPGCESAPEAYSVQQDSYAQELAFDKRRARRRRVGQRLRTLAMIVLIPLGLVAIFLASYALTCILNGASPNEVLQHLAALGQRLVVSLAASRSNTVLAQRPLHGSLAIIAGGALGLHGLRGKCAQQRQRAKSGGAQ